MTDPNLPRRRFRTALLAGGVALALSGAGAAAVFAATTPATPESSASDSASAGAEARSGTKGHEGHGRHGGFGLRNALHGEFVVERDGSTLTMVIQRGTVEAVSDTSVTVKSSDGFSQSYTLNAETEIRKVPEAAAEGTFEPPADATAADLAVGDEIHIAGTKDGSSVTAEHVMAGDLPEPGEKHGEKHGDKRGGGFDGHRGHGFGLRP